MRGALFLGVEVPGGPLRVVEVFAGVPWRELETGVALKRGRDAWLTSLAL